MLIFDAYNINTEPTMKLRSALCLALALATLTASAQRATRKDYIAKYHQLAINEMQRTGIPASITLAQGILESDCGNSYLATTANNHFGIKCHGWTGEKAYHDDDRNHECFRKYDTPAESFVDHSDFLVTKSRYQSLFSLDKTDYKGWAYGLKSAGYATDPNYAKRLIDIIEQEGLSQYDKEPKAEKTETPAPAATPQPSTTPEPRRISIRKDADFVINPFNEHEVRYNNGVKYVEVLPGDSFESIAREFHLMTSEVLSYNDLTSADDIRSMRFVYIRSKRNRAHQDCPTHTVRKGETAWQVAHKYGIKLRKLRKYNKLSNGTEPAAGTELKLR